MKWPTVPFTRVAEVITGNTPPKKDLENYGAGIPWVKPPDLDGWEPITETEETLSEIGQRKARLLPPGTIMVCCIGSIGRVGIAGTTLATNQQINSLIFGPLVKPKFGYYYCRSIAHIFQALARQSVVPILNKGHFEKIEMPLPSLSEQRRIVEILDQADGLRKKHAEADAKAERILPALFYKMFGDPATNSKGWDIVELGNLCTRITSGSRGWAKYAGYGNSFFVRTQDINDSEISTDLLRIAPPLGTEADRTRLCYRDVVITITGVVGKAAVFRENSDNVYVSQHVALVRPKTILEPEYLAAFANLSSRDVPLLARFQYGQTKPGLGFRELRSAQLPLPPIALQRRFAGEAQHIRVLKQDRRRAKAYLEKIWVALLQRAFTGDLTAEWREAYTEQFLAEMKEDTGAVDTHGLTPVALAEEAFIHIEGCMPSNSL